MVDRKLTGAHYGLFDWLLQRITAVIMLAYTLAILICLIFLPSDYASWQVFFSSTFVRVVTQITVFAVAYHAWVGIRDIWMDYIKPVGIRLTMHVLTILWLLGVCVYSIRVIWGV